MQRLCSAAAKYRRTEKHGRGGGAGAAAYSEATLLVRQRARDRAHWHLGHTGTMLYICIAYNVWPCMYS